MSDVPASTPEIDVVKPMPRYVHLTAKSSFSLLEGMAPIKKLAKFVDKEGMVALGITELGNLFPAAEITKYLAPTGVQPILGCELPVWLPEEKLSGRPAGVGMLTLLVQNETGWHNLAKLVSAMNLSKHTVQEYGGEPGVTLADVLEKNDGLIALTGPYNRGLLDVWRKSSFALSDLMAPLQQAFGNRLFGQLERHYNHPALGVLEGFEKAAAAERDSEAAVLELDIPLVATNDSRFLKAGDCEAFETLVCIGDSTTLDDPNRRRFSPRHCLRSEEDMCATFADVPSALANSVAIAQRCAFILPQVSVKKMYMPQWEFSPGENVDDVLRKRAAEGLEQRLQDFVYPFCDGEEAKQTAREKYYKQLEFELNTIITMGFPGYFLITSDFITWAKDHGIPVGPGRGSGAGSLVAWSLKITNLDPIRWELYFERFLNPERVSLPDFDVDFCQDRREEVIAYVRERFGHDRVSQIITFGTLKARACLRDVGRVLGLGYSFVGQIAAFIPEVAQPPKIEDVLASDERLKERYENEEDVKRLVDMAMALEGCYRHASTHAAGVIICDRPIDAVCGLYVDPRSEMPATQLSMSDAEFAGLVKFDFLGLKTLSVVRMAEKLVKLKKPEEGGGPDFDIDKIDLTDQQTFDMLKVGLTCGVFQIEGAGITEITKKMQADDMESLSAVLALYRPGPLGTGMVDDYINRKLGKATPEYPHDILKPALEVTYGVPVYQEQIMQMARDLAGYTLGGADMLRRAMGKKKAEEMAKERAKFVKGAAELHGVDEEQANYIFDLMDKFSGYGFNKAHTIAYALISYQTAWLKAHHPLEFMAATMTYDRGNTDKLLRYKQELQNMGYVLKPADVNASGVFFTVERGPADFKKIQAAKTPGDIAALMAANGGVRHALAALKGAGEDAARKIVADREAKGAFKDIWDMMARLDPQVMTKRQLEVMAKGGAFDSIAPKLPDGTPDKDFRGLVLANLDALQSYCSACADQRNSGQNSLFGGGDDGALDPAPFASAMQPPLDLDHLTRLGLEQQAVGFYMSSHPLEAFEEELGKMGSMVGLNELEEFAHNGGGQCLAAGIVLSVREVKTKSGNRMGVVTFSDQTGQAEVAFFPEAYSAVGEKLEAGKPFLLTLKVSQDGDRLRINSENIRALEDVLGERSNLELELISAAAGERVLARVQRVLDSGKGGRTRVRLKIPGKHGQVVVKLADGYTCDTRMLSNLRGIQGLLVN